MTKLEFTCRRPECDTKFYRYASQVRSSDGVYCSKECKSLDQRETMSGQNNPNYRDGNTLNTICECGNEKDCRAEKCAFCAKRGFKITFAGPIGSAGRVSEKEIREIVSEALSLTSAAKQLGLSRTSLTKSINTLGLDVSHMRPARGRIQPIEEYFTRSDKRINATLIRLIKQNDLIAHDRCSECGQGDTWNGKTLVLELDHINGDCYDNRLENLRFLCPNCHTQTETSRGRNAAKKVGDAL